MNISGKKSYANFRLEILLLNLLLLSFSAIQAATPTIKHTLLVSGTGLNYVGIIDSTGKIAWKHDEAEAGNGQKNDCWLLPNGNVIYSYQWGIRIVSVRTNKVIWDRPTPKRNNQTGEVHSCQPLEGGSCKFLIGECFQDTAFIVEVDTTKKEWRRIPLKNQGGGTHGKWRQIRKTPQNTYLVSSMDLYRSFEYDTTGKLVREFSAGGYFASRLENGNTLTGTGGDCRFVEFDGSGTKIWEVNNSTQKVSGLVIGFGSEAQRLPNGNTIITNWGGHGTGSGASVVEIKPDRSVVGALPSSFPTQIASVKVIDGWKFPDTTVNIMQFQIHPKSTFKPQISRIAGGNLFYVIPCIGETEISLFDCNGKLITSRQVEGKGSFQVSRSLAHGMYLVTLKNDHQRKPWVETIQW